MPRCAPNGQGPCNDVASPSRRRLNAPNPPSRQRNPPEAGKPAHRPAKSAKGRGGQASRRVNPPEGEADKHLADKRRMNDDPEINFGAKHLIDASPCRRRLNGRGMQAGGSTVTGIYRKTGLFPYQPVINEYLKVLFVNMGISRNANVAIRVISSPAFLE